MKKLFQISAFVFAALMLLAFIPVFGEGEWRSDLRRVNDLSRVLDDPDGLNEKACALVEELEFDFVTITYDNEILGTDEDFEYIEYLYKHNELGWGADHDGLVLAVNTDSEVLLMEAFGRAIFVFVDNVMDETAVAIRRGYAEGGYDGAVSAFLDSASETVRSSAVRNSDVLQYYDPDIPVYYGTESIAAPQMPAWYPANVDAWTWSAAPAGTPRVVDDADMLTPEEEAALEARIAEIVPQYDTDIVIFTDNSTHGLSRAVYAADFYDFNGYGCGPEHDGFCLFICMDPNSRGGWCCVTGSEPRRLYTEENANAIDDVLYAYLGRGDYYYGIADWVENIRTLLDKGVPFAPEWYPSIKDNGMRKNDPNAARVTDAVGAFTPEQIQALTEKAKKISEKYGVDVAVHAGDRSTGLGPQEYTDAFYRCKGYGFGERFDGIMLSLFDGAYMHVEGAAADKLTQLNVERLKEGAESAYSGGAYAAANRWLDYLDKTLKTGRTPRTPAVWGIRSAIAGLVSLLTSSANMSSAKRSMHTVRTAYEASDHLVGDSLRIGNAADTFTHNTVTRVYSPIVHESSGGKTGSSGGSSYSGGYSGSSGTSHSGSGRDF